MSELSLRLVWSRELHGSYGQIMGDGQVCCGRRAKGIASDGVKRSGTLTQ